MPTMDPNKDHSITLDEGSALTKNYRDTHPSGAPLGFAISASAMQQIINQTGCVWVRTYYAQNRAGKLEAVLVGVDKDGNDMYNGILMNRTYENPPYTSTSNPLNY